MDREKAIRDSERAAVERWFPRSPLGQLFDPGDGRMLRVRDDAVPQWRDEAFAVIDEFVADTQRLHWSGVAVIAAVALASFAAIYSHHSAYAGVAMGLGMAAVHILGVLRLQRFRRDIAAVRTRIRATLATSTPLPAELSARFRQGNRWRTALHYWVGGLVISAGLGAHFLQPDQIPPIAVTIGLICIGIAWMLFFLAQRADRELAAAR
ncbi:MAG: hypothetical protein V4574_19540 [Pseudomonadota bacterium]